MTTTMKNALAKEIDFINDLLAYENTVELEPLETIADAELQISGYEDSFGNDLPEGLKDPATMILVWNHCVAEEKAAYAKQQAEQKDAMIREAYPNWLEYSGEYEDPALGSLWFDPDQVRSVMTIYGHYDEAHIKVMLDALRAWADRK